MQGTESVLIATLGSEPQVVSTALDLLLQKGEKIRLVSVIHTSETQPMMSAAMQKLREEIHPPNYANELQLVFLPVRDRAGHTAEDVDSREAVDSVFRILYAQICQAKQKGCKVHLSIAGGRKTMSVFGMAAAQLLFDEDDRLWHLFSSGDFLRSKRMHPQPGDEVSLLPVPVMIWPKLSPVFRQLHLIEDPRQALAELEALGLRAKVEQAERFVEKELTKRERDVVRCFVQDSLDYEGISEKMVISVRTVERHLGNIYQKAEDFWGLEEVKGAQLVGLLRMYFEMKIEGKPS